jgi:hypothetical protein
MEMESRQRRGRDGGRPAGIRAALAITRALWSAFAAVLAGALLASAAEPFLQAWPRRRRAG